MLFTCINNDSTQGDDIIRPLIFGKQYRVRTVYEDSDLNRYYDVGELTERTEPQRSVETGEIIPFSTIDEGGVYWYHRSFFDHNGKEVQVCKS